MDIFSEFGKIKDECPDNGRIRELVGNLKDYISANYYTCNDKILKSLGQMYADGGKMTENIDRCAGRGTATFVCNAIFEYVSEK